MDIITPIIAAVFGMAGAVLVAWINKRKTKVDLEKIAAEKVSVEVETLRTALELAGAHIAKLQDQVNRNETALDIERTLRRKLERKFDAVIAWVRRTMPKADVDGFLAQLEAGQGA